jgi:predicted ribosomally synthesized peptide with SipW-like signal peptide
MKPWLRAIALVALALALGGTASLAQMIDNTQATNPIKAGINKSLSEEVGAGRGNVNVVGSSSLAPRCASESRRSWRDCATTKRSRA